MNQFQEIFDKQKAYFDSDATKNARVIPHSGQDPKRTGNLADRASLLCGALIPRSFFGPVSAAHV